MSQFIKDKTRTKKIDNIIYRTGHPSDGFMLADEFQKHFEETVKDIYKTELKYDLNYFYTLEKYHQFAAAGAVVDNEIIGYVVGQCTPHIFMNHKKMCTVYMMYVKPEYRRKGVIKNLIKFFETEVKMYHRCNYLNFGLGNNKTLERMMHKLGYFTADIVVTKELS